MANPFSVTQRAAQRAKQMIQRREKRNRVSDYLNTTENWKMVHEWLCIFYNNWSEWIHLTLALSPHLPPSSCHHLQFANLNKPAISYSQLRPPPLWSSQLSQTFSSAHTNVVLNGKKSFFNKKTYHFSLVRSVDKHVLRNSVVAVFRLCKRSLLCDSPIRLHQVVIIGQDNNITYLINLVTYWVITAGIIDFYTFEHLLAIFSENNLLFTLLK